METDGWADEWVDGRVDGMGWMSGVGAYICPRGGAKSTILFLITNYLRDKIPQRECPTTHLHDIGNVTVSPSDQSFAVLGLGEL